MTIKEYLKKKQFKQIEIASAIDAPISVINVYCNGWKPLPEKHIEQFAKFVGLSEKEVKSGRVRAEI